MVKHPKLSKGWIGPFTCMVQVSHPETVKVILKSSGTIFHVFFCLLLYNYFLLHFSIVYFVESIMILFFQFQNFPCDNVALHQYYFFTCHVRIQKVEKGGPDPHSPGKSPIICYNHKLSLEIPREPLLLEKGQYGPL